MTKDFRSHITPHYTAQHTHTNINSYQIAIKIKGELGVSSLFRGHANLISIVPHFGLKN